jgi:nitrogen fixation protein NifB
MGTLACSIRIILPTNPVFNGKAKVLHSQVHLLSVVPKDNIQCNTCNHTYDCINVSRPGIASTLPRPEQILGCLDIGAQFRPEV